MRVPCVAGVLAITAGVGFRAVSSSTTLALALLWVRAEVIT
jgi:hypothetical protein